MSSFRSGFASFVGRPNAGKSTLLNALVGEKVAITSSRPQTTRHVARGILNRPNAQLVIVDTPGLHKPRTLLGSRLNDRVREAWSSVDIVVLVIPANESVGPGDAFIAREISFLRSVSFVVALTKTDLVDKKTIAERIVQIAELGTEVGIDWAAIVPVSAVSGEQTDVLVDVLVDLLPEGPMLYPEDQRTDESEEIMVAELIREAALEGVKDELPHSIAVVIEEMSLREDRPADSPLTDISAFVFVERESQKAIVIGKGGSRLKEVGTKARKEIEQLLGTKVFLDLRVKVAKDWQRDPKQLNRLGF